VSQDHVLTRRLWTPFGHILPVLETFLSLPINWINHVEFESQGPVSLSWPALGLSFPNGISLSEDGKQLAVASSSSGHVHFYQRGERNSLKHSSTVSLPFAVDNVVFNSEGELMVAGHPYFPGLILVARNISRTAPSWVVAIAPLNESRVIASAAQPSSYESWTSANLTIRTIYQSDGTGFSTSSTALSDKTFGKVFITGLYAEGILECQISVST